MGIGEAILGFLKALPDIINMINRIVAQYETMKKEGTLNEIHSAIDQSEVAKTPQERSAAMLRLVRAVARPR